MENISYLNNRFKKNNEIEDYINEHIEIEELELMKDLRIRKIKLLGLGSVYVILFFLSFMFLN